MGVNRTTPHYSNEDALFTITERVSHSSFRVSIDPPMAQNDGREGAIDFSLYERKAERIGETSFLIRHLADENFDIAIEMHVNEDG